jgi:hypothetical protein
MQAKTSGFDPELTSRTDRYRCPSFPDFCSIALTMREDSMSKACIVVEHIIADTAKFEEYRTKVGPMIAFVRSAGRLVIIMAGRRLRPGG